MTMTPSAPSRYKNVKPIAYYLPQFHPVPDNDKWWGNGFTEWRSCTAARPLFPGHIQPKLPGDLGFYDLRRVETQHEQAEMARAYGIRGFCHYFYWFDGRRILERPTEILLEHKDIDIDFCLCWANESWSRRWDGQERDVLLPQRYDPTTFQAFANELLRYFSDDRYIKIDGKPVFLIYRSAHVEHMERLVATLRTSVERAGFPGLYLVGAETFVDYGEWEDPRKYGLDAAVEFPPHATKSDWFNPRRVLGDRFEGALYEQLSTYVNNIIRPDPDYPLHRCLFPGWDNTARRDSRASIYLGASPELFALWLDHHCQWTERVHAPQSQLLFINAWNEWAEGAYLEPDITNGHAYLEVVRDVLTGKHHFSHPVNSTQLAGLNAEERERFASTYIRAARPTLGVEAQTRAVTKAKFRVPERLYTHNREVSFPVCVTREDERVVEHFERLQTSYQPIMARVRRSSQTLRNLPHSVVDWRNRTARVVVRNLRVEDPKSASQKARDRTYKILRTGYRLIKGPLIPKR